MEGIHSQPVDLLKYLIEPEWFIVSGGEKGSGSKMQLWIFDLKLQQWGCISMTTGK